MLTAPVLYFLAIEKGKRSFAALFRVAALGLVLSRFMLPRQENGLLSLATTWLLPLAELTVVLFLLLTLYRHQKQQKEKPGEDFLFRCRQALIPLTGARIARILATEISIPYYLLARRPHFDQQHRFSTFRCNGSGMILGTVLALLVIETAGLHFLIASWNKTLAWVLTGLSVYTCLQLLAHIRALRVRGIVVQDRVWYIRNGLLGGEVEIPVDDIKRIETTFKSIQGNDAVKLTLIPLLESHNLLICLGGEVIVQKAFGRLKKARQLMIQVDEPDLLIERWKDACTQK
jgi:hypothetical protein